MQHRYLIGAAIVVAAGSSLAVAGGDLLNGNARFRVGVSNAISSSAIPFTAPNGEGDLVTDTGGPDQISRNLWYIRGGNQQTGLFNRLNSPGPGAESYSGNSGTFSYSDYFVSSTVARPLAVVYRATLTDFAAADTALVVQQFTFTNNSASSISFTLFNLLAPNLRGTVSDDSVSFNNSDPTDQRFSDGTSTWQFRGYGATRGQAGEARSTGIFSLFPTSQSGTTSTSSLSNGIQGGGASFGNSIFGVAGVLQFNITLAPGASTDIFSAIGVNTAAIPTPGSVALLGLGGLLAGRRRR